MNKQFLTFIFIATLAFTSAVCFAAFPVRSEQNNAWRGISDSVSSIDEEYDPLPYSGKHHSGGRHGGHRSSGHHFHGIAHHSHFHSAYHYRTKNYHDGYHRRYDNAFFGGLSLLFAIWTPFELLLYGSICAIAVGLCGTVFGLFGLAADRWKRLALLGLVICLIEAAILVALYAALII